MLYLLEIENFYCIRTAQTVDLRIGEGVGDEPGRFDTLFPGSKERASRVVAFFGPNASGKSTVLKALAFVAWFIKDSFQLVPDAGLPCERFNDADAQMQPIRLAIEASAALDPTAETVDETTKFGTWRYELSVQSIRGRYVVGSETLKQRADGRGKWVRVFERSGAEIKGGKVFGLAGYANVNSITSLRCGYARLLSRSSPTSWLIATRSLIRMRSVTTPPTRHPWRH